MLTVLTACLQLQMLVNEEPKFFFPGLKFSKRKNVERGEENKKWENTRNVKIPKKLETRMGFIDLGS